MGCEKKQQHINIQTVGVVPQLLSRGPASNIKPYINRLSNLWQGEGIITAFFCQNKSLLIVLCPSVTSLVIQQGGHPPTFYM